MVGTDVGPLEGLVGVVGDELGVGGGLTVWVALPRRWISGTATLGCPRRGWADSRT